MRESNSILFIFAISLSSSSGHSFSRSERFWCRNCLEIDGWFLDQMLQAIESVKQKPIFSITIQNSKCSSTQPWDGERIETRNTNFINWKSWNRIPNALPIKIAQCEHVYFHEQIHQCTTTYQLHGQSIYTFKLCAVYVQQLQQTFDPIDVRVLFLYLSLCVFRCPHARIPITLHYEE